MLTSAVVTPIPSPDRTELITQLHIMACLQERDCRERGLDLATAPESVKIYCIAWLYGAACQLGGRTFRHTEALARLVAELGGRKLHLDSFKAEQAIATLTGCSTKLACFRNGLEGADCWQTRRHVPARNGLYEVITGNAFI